MDLAPLVASVGAFIAFVVTKEITRSGLGPFLRSVPELCRDAAIALRSVTFLSIRVVIVPLSALFHLANAAGRGLAYISTDPLHTANVIAIWAWGCAACSILCVAQSMYQLIAQGTGMGPPVAQAFVWLILLGLVREVVQGIVSNTRTPISPKHHLFLMCCDRSSTGAESGVMQSV